MKKSFLAGTIAVVMFAAVLVAGCTSPTAPSPTPAPSASTSAAVTTTTAAQNVSQYLTTMMQQRNFTVVTPFSLQSSPQSGVAVYNATVSDSNGTYAVSVWALRSPQSAQAQFLSIRNMYKGRGYAAAYQNAMAWSGFNARARAGAAVEYGTSPLISSYMMVTTGGAVGQASFRQAVWQHLWDEMHEHMGYGGGMGRFMGQGINANMRTRMPQEMEEHMGGNFGGMMGGR